MDGSVRTHAARLIASVVAVVAFCGCVNTKFNQLGPGERAGAPAPVPDAIDVEASGFDVHLDPTVMLWARDAGVDLRALIRTEIARIARRLDSSPVEISISAGSYRIIPDVGIGGLTDPGTGRLTISMDSRSPVGLDELLSIWLPIVLAHELHHSHRVLDGPGYGRTLADAVVTEGSAEAFVRETYPDAPPIPWVEPLSLNDARDVWRRAKDELPRADTAERHDRWFFGKDELPRWAGYKLGYAIVRAYLDRHTDVDAADIATMSTHEIIAGSRYDPDDAASRR